MSSTCASISTVVCLLLLSFGCDRDAATAPPPTPAEVERAQEELQSKDPARGARPTTAALLGGPRRTIRLGVVPLTVLAPLEQWEVKTYGDEGVTFLEGPSPNDDVRISLSRRTAMTADQIDLMEKGAAKELRENPDTIRVAEARTAGNVKVFERQSLRRPPALPDPAPPATQPSLAPYRWTVTLFVPTSGKAYEVYELNFVDMTEGLYTLDKDFLREIVNSVRYDAQAEDLSILEASTKKRD